MVIYSDDNVKLGISDYYYTITIGKKTWYWNKDDGKFDGTSTEVVKHTPVLLPIS